MGSSHDLATARALPGPCLVVGRWYLGAHRTMPSLTIDEVQSRSRQCGRCGAQFQLAIPASPADRQVLADLAKQSAIPFCKTIREMTGCSLADAKAMRYHLSPARGTCCWCRADIPPDELVDCPSCGALTLVDAQRSALSRFPMAVEISGRYRRDPAWRPLTEAEIADARARRESCGWHSPGAP
jgi:hypothetical protein